MKNATPIRLWLSILMVLGFTAPAFAAERSTIPVKYTWDLTAFFPNEDAWGVAKQKLERQIATFAHFQGHLGASPDSLLAGLDLLMNLNRDLERISAYASMLADQDARVSKHIEMRQSAEHLGVALGSASAFVTPEIL